VAAVTGRLKVTFSKNGCAIVVLLKKTSL